MPRALLYVLFLAVVAFLLFGMHWYVHRSYLRLPGWSPAWRTAGTWTLGAMALLVAAAFAFGHFGSEPWQRWVAFAGYVWLGTLFLLAMVAIGLDVVRFSGRGLAALLKLDAFDPERRALFARLVGGGAAMASVVAGGIAVRAAVRGPQDCHVEIKLKKLPAGADGLRIVQWSDVHVGPTIRRAFVEDLVRRTNAVQPDLIVITGDLVDGSVAMLRDEVAPMAQLRARHGVWFVTGNHEYFSGADAWIAELTRLGVRVLQNERVTIGAGDAAFDLAGVHDWTAARLHPEHTPDLARALHGRDPDRALVLLAHQPRAIWQAAAAGVDLVLSGHTHGGQIWPFNYLVRLAQPYVAGLADHEGTQIYVSRGTGWWGPPMRLGTTSELTHFTLRAA
ncbi:MAG: metallophosphoesterase [Myxococcales bacterium]|nr:metallophosphoesterase [Myxococcales bacterium]